MKATHPTQNRASAMRTWQRVQHNMITFLRGLHASALSSLCPQQYSDAQRSKLKRRPVSRSFQTFTSISPGSNTVPLERIWTQSPVAAGRGWWGGRCSAPTGKRNSNQSPPQPGRTAGLKRSQLPALWRWRASPENRHISCLSNKQFVWLTRKKKSSGETIFFPLHTEFDPDCRSTPFCYHKTLPYLDLYNTNDGCFRNCTPLVSLFES